MQPLNFLSPNLRPRPLELPWRHAPWLTLAGVAFLTLASKIQVPLPIVPITMQTYAVVLIGAAYGPRLGVLTVAVWLGAAFAGLPLLAGPIGGPTYFLGPTGGYLLSFPLACLFVAFCAARAPRRRRLGWLCLAMLAGHAVTLALGAGWLVIHSNWQRAVELGVSPFIAGSVLKSFLAATSYELLMRFQEHLSNNINSGEPS